MKIIHVLNHFLPHQNGGTEIYVWSLSKHLQMRGVEVRICIPNYESNISNEYIYDDLKVHKYPETSRVDRNLILGYRPPEGLKNFLLYVKDEKPDIIHFHEIAGSNGITLHHVKAISELGYKTLMTFHLAGYSCKTGSLIHNKTDLCDGIIDLKKCSHCYLASQGYKWMSNLIVSASLGLNYLSINPTLWNNPAGTAFGIINIFKKLKADLFSLVDYCDKVVVIAEWYRTVLLNNGIDPSKISFISQGLPSQVNNVSTNIIPYQPPLKLIFLGRISKFKGVHLLISAISQIPAEKITLHIYGIPESNDYVDGLIRKTKAMSNVFWEGPLEQDSVVGKLREHHVLCLCSTFSEMSPLVIQEAFEAGIPVIASNVYGNAEQITHGKNGLLFKFNDIVDLKRQLTSILLDPQILIKVRSERKYPRGFDNVASDYQELYKSLLI